MKNSPSNCRLYPNLQQSLANGLRAYGFVENENSFSFSKVNRRGDRLSVVFLVDPRGNNLAVTANLKVTRVDHPNSPPTVSNIGYLMPQHQWHEWQINPAIDNDDQADEIIRQIAMCVLPWFRTMIRTKRRWQRHAAAPEKWVRRPVATLRFGS